MGRSSAQGARIALWAQLLPVHMCLVYACQFSSNSVHKNGEIDVQMSCTQEKREREWHLDPMGWKTPRGKKKKNNCGSIQ